MVQLQIYNKCSGTYAHVCMRLRVFIIDNNNNNNINSQVDRAFDYYCATVRGGCNSSSWGHRVNTRLRRYTSYIYTRIRRTYNATNTGSGRRLAVDPGPAIFVDVNTAAVAAAVPRAIRRG